MIEQHLRDWLLADTNISAKIGDRYYPQSVPKNVVLPAVSYAMVSDQATLQLNGVSSKRQPTIQLSIICATQVEASEISELIKNRINAWAADYADLTTSACYAEGNISLSLDYYTPQRFGTMLEAFLHYVMK